MNISQRTIWILIGAVTVMAAVVIVVLMVVSKTRQTALPPPTPTISVELAMAEIQMKMTAESLSVLLAAVTQTALAPTATPVPTSTPEPAAGSVQVSTIDGMEMVYITKGSFWMGAQDSDSLAQIEEKPLHEVMISGFWMDRELITNAMYMRCVKSGRCTAPVANDDVNTNYGKSEFLNYPIVYISWDQADIYCHAVGRRLPTEAEWEKAARGTDGRIYPWGDNPPDKELANFNGEFKSVQVIGKYLKGASPYGVLDMAGNAHEWVHDWFSGTYYAELTALKVTMDPTGPKEGTEKVLRGGSFTDTEVYLRTTSRLKHAPSSNGDNRGFRCAFSDISPF